MSARKIIEALEKELETIEKTTPFPVSSEDSSFIKGIEFAIDHIKETYGIDEFAGWVEKEKAFWAEKEAR